MMNGCVGAGQTEVPGESVQALFSGIQVGARAASVGDASSSQQTSAAAPVAPVTRNIGAPTSQVLEGITQPETAAHRWEELSRSVTELLAGYRV